MNEDCARHGTTGHRGRETRLRDVNRPPQWLLPTLLTVLVLAVVAGALFT
jgi:hypothetical protein